MVMDSEMDSERLAFIVNTAITLVSAPDNERERSENVMGGKNSAVENCEVLCHDTFFRHSSYQETLTECLNALTHLYILKIVSLEELTSSSFHFESTCIFFRSHAVFMVDCFCSSSVVNVPVWIPHAEESSIYFVLYTDAVLV